MLIPESNADQFWCPLSRTVPEKIGATFDQPYGRSVLRWAARGLTPPAALKKASVDTEIAQRHVGGKCVSRTSGGTNVQ